MVGGGSRRDQGSLVMNNTNVFAALESLRKKRKSDKSSKSKGSSKAPAKEPEVFWAPAPLAAKSWADVDDDDDYYETNAPPQSVWSSTQQEQAKEKLASVELQESESEEDLLDEGDDDEEEEHVHEPEVPVVKKPVEVSLALPKEAERQLSKKEIKKKELAELEALLADFQVSQKENNAQDESSDIATEERLGKPNGDAETKENAPAESKSVKKKKKKDKSSKEAKEPEGQANSLDITNGSEKNTGNEQVEEAASGVDMKERLKKVALAKKKKSNKEMDAAARSAATEAAARSAKLAAAKKKEKNHYNQQPVR